MSWILIWGSFGDFYVCIQTHSNLIYYDIISTYPVPILTLYCFCYYLMLSYFCICTSFVLYCLVIHDLKIYMYYDIISTYYNQVPILTLYCFCYYLMLSYFCICTSLVLYCLVIRLSSKILYLLLIYNVNLNC